MLRRVLSSAERVLVADGFEEFTMAAVAEDAGVSVGAIYRRFAGKEELLAAVKDRMLSALEESLEESVRASGTDLASTVRAFVDSITASLAANDRAFPELLRPAAELAGRGRQAVASMQRIFEEATEPFLPEVRRQDPRAAVSAVHQMIVGSCVHRASMPRDSAPGYERSWEWYANQLSEMAIVYLTTAESAVSA